MQCNACNLAKSTQTRAKQVSRGLPDRVRPLRGEADEGGVGAVKTRARSRAARAGVGLEAGLLELGVGLEVGLLGLGVGLEVRLLGLGVGLEFGRIGLGVGIEVGLLWLGVMLSVGLLGILAGCGRCCTPAAWIHREVPCDVHCLGGPSWAVSSVASTPLGRTGVLGAGLWRAAGSGPGDYVRAEGSRSFGLGPEELVGQWREEPCDDFGPGWCSVCAVARAGCPALGLSGLRAW